MKKFALRFRFGALKHSTGHHLPSSPFGMEEEAVGLPTSTSVGSAVIAWNVRHFSDIKASARTERGSEEVNLIHRVWNETTP